MGKKYKYDFYFKIENESKSDEKSLNDYATLSLERYLPLDEEEYENAVEKLVESVSNSTGINKKYITAISKEEFMKK